MRAFSTTADPKHMLLLSTNKKIAYNLYCCATCMDIEVRFIVKSYLKTCWLLDKERRPVHNIKVSILKAILGWNIVP